jgi:hypothetical protein
VYLHDYRPQIPIVCAPDHGIASIGDRAADYPASSSSILDTGSARVADDLGLYRIVLN